MVNYCWSKEQNARLLSTFFTFTPPLHLFLFSAFLSSLHSTTELLVVHLCHIYDTSTCSALRISIMGSSAISNTQVHHPHTVRLVLALSTVCFYDPEPVPKAYSRGRPEQGASSPQDSLKTILSHQFTHLHVFILLEETHTNAQGTCNLHTCITYFPCISTDLGSVPNKPLPTDSPDCLLHRPPAPSVCKMNRYVSLSVDQLAHAQRSWMQGVVPSCNSAHGGWRVCSRGWAMGHIAVVNSPGIYHSANPVSL